jgi:hypothetical protein
LFFEERNVADGAPGGEPRLVFGQSPLDVLLCQLLEMERQLSGELVVHGVASKERS